MLDNEVEKIMATPWSYPGLVPRDSSSLLLSFSTNDSIRIWSSWYVFMSSMQFFLRRIEWPRSADRFPISAVGPTTFGSEVPLQKAIAESLIDSAINIVSSNASRPPASLTIDGVYYSITIWRNGESKEVSWVHGLKGTSALEEWLASSEFFASKLLPESSAKVAQGTL